MLLHKPLFLVLLLVLSAIGLAPAYAERGSRSATEHSGSERSTRDRLRSERTVRERGKTDRQSRGGQTRTGDAALSTSNSGPGSTSSGSGSGGSDSSGPGSDGSGTRIEDRSGPSSESEMQARMMSGAGTPIAIERDARGREQRAGEVLVVSESSAAPVARAAGYEVIEERPLTTFNEILVRVRIPPGQDAQTTLTALRTLLPAATVAVNHVFRPSNDGTASGPLSSGALSSDTAANSAAAADARATSSARIGVIDTGAFEQSAALQGSIEQVGAFAGSPYTPREHGTVVCEIAAARGARLRVADVFGVDADARLIAAADAIASALNWLVGSSTPVINISVAGPYNPILEHIIERAVARGTLIVAAAGNAGPAAAPVYPAAYAGVVAVTAVDERGRVYRRANRGDYVMFAARGVHVPVQGSPMQGNSESFEVSGTSFAAPVVAAELARLRMLSPAVASLALLERLKRSATDLGTRGRDPVYGWGSIGEVRIKDQ